MCAVIVGRKCGRAEMSAHRRSTIESDMENPLPYSSQPSCFFSRPFLSTSPRSLFGNVILERTSAMHSCLENSLQSYVIHSSLSPSRSVIDSEFMSEHRSSNIQSREERSAQSSSCSNSNPESVHARSTIEVDDECPASSSSSANSDSESVHSESTITANEECPTPRSAIQSDKETSQLSSSADGDLPLLSSVCAKRSSIHLHTPASPSKDRNSLLHQFALICAKRRDEYMAQKLRTTPVKKVHQNDDASPAAPQKRDLLPTVEEEARTVWSTPHINGQWSLLVSTEGRQTSRRGMSLAQLCMQFIQLFPMDMDGKEEDRWVFVDKVAEELNTEKRRIYDIINIFESLEIVHKVDRAESKCGKTYYYWLGNTRLKETLFRIRLLAEASEYVQLICRIVNRQPSPAVIDDSSEDSKENDTKEKGKTLGVMCQKFIMCFLVIDQPKVMSFDLISNIILCNGTEGNDAQPKQTKVRRLYDIANVLSTLKIIEKGVLVIDQSRKTGFKYIGPDVSGTIPLTRRNFEPSRHSLLPATPKKSPDGSTLTTVPKEMKCKLEQEQSTKRKACGFIQAPANETKSESEPPAKKKPSGITAKGKNSFTSHSNLIPVTTVGIQILPHSSGTTISGTPTRRLPSATANTAMPFMSVADNYPCPTQNTALLPASPVTVISQIDQASHLCTFSLNTVNYQQSAQGAFNSPAVRPNIVFVPCQGAVTFNSHVSEKKEEKS